MWPVPTINFLRKRKGSFPYWQCCKIICLCHYIKVVGIVKLCNLKKSVTLNFIIDRLTTRVSIRQISILQQPFHHPRHHPQLLSLHRPPGCQGSSRSVSTMEAMYMKLISLPMVHQLEDTLAQVHDTAGVSDDTCQDSSDVLWCQDYPGGPPSWSPLPCSGFSSLCQPTSRSRRWWPKGEKITVNIDIGKMAYVADI